MSTPQWFADFEREEAKRQERLDIIHGDMARRNLTAQLCELTKRWTTYEDIPVSQQHECRDIGRKLHAQGGEALMRDAYYAAKGQNQAALTLAAYWDGIGDWRW